MAFIKMLSVMQDKQHDVLAEFVIKLNLAQQTGIILAF